jgi:hypothetical protein
MGKVTLENPPVTTDGFGPRGVRVTLTHEPDLVGLPGAPQGAVQANGTFCLANVAQGDFRVYVPPLLNTFQWGTSTLPAQLQNGYIKSIRLGGADVLTNGLRLNFAPQEQLEILIGSGAKLSGTVVNDKRESVVNATVALVPQLRVSELIFIERQQAIRMADTRCRASSRQLPSYAGRTLNGMRQDPPFFH